MPSNDVPVPESPTVYRAPKNLCRVCGVDFATLTGFDDHRKEYRINHRQQLVGWCLHPTEMGYVEYNGAWYTPEGKAKVLGSVAALAKYRAATS